MIIEQRGLREALTEILREEQDYTFNDDAIANFTLKITRKGTGLETSYSILPKLASKVSKEVTQAFAEVVDTAKVDTLLQGQHPLLAPKAEFASSSSEGGSEF